MELRGKARVPEKLDVLLPVGLEELAEHLRGDEGAALGADVVGHPHGVRLIVLDVLFSDLEMEVEEPLHHGLDLLGLLKACAEALGKAHEVDKALEKARDIVGHDDLLAAVDLLEVLLGHHLPVHAAEVGELDYVAPLGDVVYHELTGLGDSAVHRRLAYDVLYAEAVEARAHALPVLTQNGGAYERPRRPGQVFGHFTADDAEVIVTVVEGHFHHAFLEIFMRLLYNANIPIAIFILRFTSASPGIILSEKAFIGEGVSIRPREKTTSRRER